MISLCEFPLVCGVSKGVCCWDCKSKCKYHCELKKEECDCHKEVEDENI